MRTTWVSVAFVGCACMAVLAAPVPKRKPAVLWFGDFKYELPAWWDSVTVDPPPKDLKDCQEVSEFVKERYGKDTGTRETWKEALKTWAVECQRLNQFPVFLAHCHRSGEEYERAAEIYSALYQLAESQGDQKDWHRAYLAYNSGQMFELLKDKKRAAEWYSRSAELVGHTDSAVDHYAKQSAERIRHLNQK